MAQAADSVSLQILKKRGDFLRAARARRRVMPGFILQGCERSAAEAPEIIRVGFTCSKKVGNAVVRNHAKRRLRELARLVLPSYGRPGWDYVLIGRAEATSTLPFQQLLSDLKRAVRRIHTDRPAH